MNVETTWSYVQPPDPVPLYVYDMQVSYEPAGRPIAAANVASSVETISFVLAVPQPE